MSAVRPRLSPVYILSRALTDGCSVDIGGGAVPIISGISALWTIGRVHRRLDDLCSALQQALQTVDATFTVTFSTTTGQVTITRVGAFDLAWTATSYYTLRDALGFEADLAAAASYAGTLTPRFCFFPDHAAVDHSGEVDFTSLAEDSPMDSVERHLRRGVTQQVATRFHLQWSSLREGDARAWVSWAGLGYPVCYHPDRTVAGTYYVICVTSELGENPLTGRTRAVNSVEFDALQVPATVHALWGEGIQSWAEWLYAAFPIFSVGHYAIIEGVPILLTEEDLSGCTGGLPAGYQQIICMDPRGTIRPIAQSIDLKEGVGTTARLDLELVETEDWQLCRWFAHVRTDAARARVQTAWAYLSFGLQWITLDDITSWAGVAAPCDVYHGRETIWCEQVDVVNSRIQLAFANRRRYLSPPTKAEIPVGGLWSASEISTAPTLHEGRVLRVYAYLRDSWGNPIDSVPWHEDLPGIPASSQAVAEIWRGIIKCHPFTSDGGRWTISTDSMLSTLDREVSCAGAHGSQLCSGMPVYEAGDFIGSPIWYVDPSNNWMDISVVRYAGPWTLDDWGSCGGVAEVIAEQSVQLQTAGGSVMSGWLQSNDLFTGIRYAINVVGSQLLAGWNLADLEVVGKWAGGFSIGIRMLTLPARTNLINLLIRWQTGKAAMEGRGVGPVIGFPWDTEFSQPRTAMWSQSHQHSTLYVGSLAAQRVLLVAEDQDSPAFPSSGYVRVGEKYILKYSARVNAPGTWPVNICALSGLSVPTSIHPEVTMDHVAESISNNENDSSAGDVLIQQVSVWDGASIWRVLIDALLGWDGTAVNPGFTNLLNGACLLARDVDVSKFLQLEGRGLACDRRTLALVEPVKVKDLLADEAILTGACVVAGFCPVRRRFLVTVAEIGQGVCQEALPQLMTQQLLSMSPAQYVESDAELIAGVRAWWSYDAAEQEWTEGRSSLFMNPEVQFAHPKAEIIELKNRGITYRYASEFKAIHELAIVRYLHWHRRARLEIELSVVQAGLVVQPGDVIFVSASLPDLNRMNWPDLSELDEVPVWVREVTPQWRPAVGSQGQGRGSGFVKIRGVLMDDGHSFRYLAPTMLVTAVTVGPDNYFTVQPNQYTNATGPRPPVYLAGGNDPGTGYGRDMHWFAGYGCFLLRAHEWATGATELHTVLMFDPVLGRVYTVGPSALVPANTIHLDIQPWGAIGSTPDDVFAFGRAAGAAVCQWS